MGSESETEHEKLSRTTRNWLDQVQREVNRVIEHLVKLEQRLNTVERKQDALNRRLEGSDRHPEDEGWFD